MKPYKNKINRIRSFALSLIFIGVVIMYIGIFFRKNEIVMLIFMLLGVLAIIASTVVYAWIGSLIHTCRPDYLSKLRKTDKNAWTGRHVRALS